MRSQIHEPHVPPLCPIGPCRKSPSGLWSTRGTNSLETDKVSQMPGSGQITVFHTFSWPCLLQKGQPGQEQVVQGIRNTRQNVNTHKDFFKKKMNKRNTKCLIMKLLERRSTSSCQPSEMGMFWDSSGNSIASARITNTTVSGPFLSA